MDTITKYPFDRDGILESNAIVNESHPIGTSKIFIPRAGAFFTDTMVIIHDGRELVKGTDWQPIAFSQDASVETSREVHFAVVIYSIESQADVLMSYHAVGGTYSNYIDQIMVTIERLGLEPSMILYGDIIGLPELFPPAPHKTAGEDLVGLSRVVEMLARIEDALTSGSKVQLDELKDALKEIQLPVGRLTLRPNTHAYDFDMTVKQHDFIIRRSDAQNAFVSVEATMVIDDRVYKLYGSFRESQNDVINVHGYYNGPAIFAGDLSLGFSIGNDNTSIMRLESTGDWKIQHMYVNALTTSDMNADTLVGTIEQLEEPVEAVIDTMALTLGGGDVTTDQLEQARGETTVVGEVVETQADEIAKIRATIDNASEI